MQHEMKDRKHKAHVRKEAVAHIKRTRITDKCESLQYCRSPHRKDENQKIKGSQRNYWQRVGGREKKKGKLHDWSINNEYPLYKNLGGSNMSNMGS